VADVLDYSSGWPAPSAIRAAKYVGVVRYIGTPGRGKNLTRTEARAMTAANIPIALVYEDSAGWMLGGVGAGAAAARASLTDAQNCGVGVRNVYFAADFDVTSTAQMVAVERCLDGAAGVLGRGRVGVYGEADVIDACLGGRHATWGWQTRAWSGGRVSSRAHLLQQIGYVYPGGVQCDRSTVMKRDWGQWPDPAQPPNGDDMPNTPQELKDAAYAALQQWATERHDSQAGGNRVDTFRELLDQFPEVTQLIADMRAEVAALRQDITAIRTAVGAPAVE
jgi:hypothetical protein